MNGGDFKNTLRNIMPTKVWLDVDPGHDDAMALILACNNSSIEVLGVSTTHGNQSVEKTTLNALRVLHLIGRSDIDVVAGLAKPILRPAVICPEIHGESGLDGVVLEESPAKPVREKAVIHTYNILRRHSDVTLVATGCLSNVALLLTLYPEVKENIARIVIMGGAVGSGNTGPVAEFNIQIDPEAASIVFEFGIPVVMVPLEVTHTALVTKDVMDRIRKTPLNDVVTKWMEFFADTYKEVFSMPDPPLHDPCAVAYVIDPSLFTCKEMRVDVETASALSSGQTVCDIYGMSPKPKNVKVAMAMNVKGFWDLMISALNA